jgi:dihydrolipoamide dehydrogenase
MYNIIFLGGGPAGYEGAVAAGKKGLKVAVVELDKVGGTCLQWGCIPTKTLLHSVKLLKQLKSSSKLGINVDNYDFNVDSMNKRKVRVVAKLTKGIEHLFKQYNVELVRGRGRIISEKSVQLVDGKELQAENIVISTGSVPATLPFLKIDGSYIIHSNHALELNDIPEKMLVIGGGAIGVEMAVIYSALGSQVTIVEILEGIIPGSDTELSEILKKELQKQKIKIFTSTSASNPVINEEERNVRLSFKQGDKEWEDSFTKVLVSVGRSPNSDNIYDDSLGIEKDNRGFIKVNQNLQTRVPHIFACGDVVGHPLLAHKASHQAIAIVDYIIDGKEIVHPPVPGAVFTFPEFASVGVTEQEAKEKGIEVKIGKFPYSAGSRSNAVGELTGLVKVIADKEGNLIGAHIVGAEAGELMPLLTYAVSKKLNAKEFKDMVFIHPTLSENIWEAVGEIGGFSIHI